MKLIKKKGLLIEIQVKPDLKLGNNLQLNVAGVTKCLLKKYEVFLTKKEKVSHIVILKIMVLSLVFRLKTPWSFSGLETQSQIRQLQLLANYSDSNVAF